MGFLSGMQKGGRDFNWGNALLAAFGGPQALQSIRQREAAEAEAEAARRARDEQVWGLKEMGFGNPEIAAMSGQDASQSARQRLEPFTLGQGSQRHTPGMGGQPSQVTTAPDPTEVQRNYEYLRTIDPELAQSYIARQSLIINQGIDPSTGAPYSQAIDPRSLFNFGGQQGQQGPPGPQAPQPVPRQQPPAAQRPGTFSYNAVPGARESSGYRTPEHNRRVGGVANSFHTIRDANGNPMASDQVPPPGMSMGAFYTEMRRRNPHLDVINEGDHVHLEPRGQSSAQGLPRANSPADVARLPSGAEFIAPDGTRRRKP
jgi:hypothetical protein